MGTDISLYAERLERGRWQPVPPPRRDQRSGDWMPQEALDMGRPYPLFSLLSGQGVGLRGGLITVPDWFANRGLPDDLSPLYRRWLPQWSDPSSGNWGRSWLECRELLDINWDVRLEHHAYVEEHLARLFQPDEPFPKEFPTEAKLYHGQLGKPPKNARKVVWSLTLREYVGDLDWFIQPLTALANGERLRIVYWFDS